MSVRSGLVAIVYPKTNIVIIYSSWCHSKPLSLSFFCGSQKAILGTPSHVLFLFCLISHFVLYWRNKVLCYVSCGTTWGWVNNGRTFNFGLTILLRRIKLFLSLASVFIKSIFKNEKYSLCIGLLLGSKFVQIHKKRLYRCFSDSCWVFMTCSKVHCILNHCIIQDVSTPLFGFSSHIS